MKDLVRFAFVSILLFGAFGAVIGAIAGGGKGAGLGALTGEAQARVLSSPPRAKKSTTVLKPA